MPNWKQCAAVEQTSEKVSGALVFKNTRVPVKSLFENLEDGVTVDDYLTWFPGVSRGQVREVLKFAAEGLAV